MDDAATTTPHLELSFPVESPAAPADPPALVLVEAGPIAALSALEPSAPAPDSLPPRSRVSGEELIADLFDAMHELQFQRDAVDGGRYCLALLMDKLPCEVGLVHLYDIDRREFLVAGTRGEKANGLLLRRHPESDPMLSLAMRRRRAVVVGEPPPDDAIDLTAIERYLVAGHARSVIAAPVMQAGRFLGAIELLDPLDGRPFTESDAHAVMYIAEQFADFVAARGIVTDPDRIARR
jgi:hypothetical protein